MGKKVHFNKLFSVKNVSVFLIGILSIGLFFYVLNSRDKSVLSNSITNELSEVKTLFDFVKLDAQSSNGIYYYNGTNVNNNMLFADKCWQIVRTTENGGVKLIYNGDPVNGTCNTTTNYIGSSAYNNNANKVTSVGYMYGDYDYGKINFFTDSKSTTTNGSWGNAATNYYYGTAAIWDGEKYTLQNEKSGNSGDYNMALTHKYTCGSLTAGMTCDIVYVASANGMSFGGGGGTTTYVSLPPGRDYGPLDYFEILENFETASTMGGQGNAVWLYSNSVYYNTSSRAFNLKTNGSSNFDYVNYDMSTWSDTTKTTINTKHFTCFVTEKTVTSVSLKSSFPNTSTMFLAPISDFYNITNSTKIDTPCTELFYVFYSGNAGLYYLKLDSQLMDNSEISSILSSINSGNYLTETLLVDNSKNSSIKKVVDAWYNSHFSNYSDLEEYLIDDVYVNDRSLSTGGGWNPNVDLTTPLQFKAYNGNTSNFNESDKLTLPVGLLSYDEAVLAGVTSSSSSYFGNNSFWLMTSYSYDEYSIDGVEYDMLAKSYIINNCLSSATVDSTNYVRPVISVKQEMPVTGSGTPDDPYRIVDSFSVTYSFSGDYPDVALPTGGDYAEGSEVSIDNSITVGQKVNGYIFNGWTSSDVTISDNKFTMPANNVSLVGTWNKLVLPELTIVPEYEDNNPLGRIYYRVNVSNPYDFKLENIKIQIADSSCYSSRCNYENDIYTYYELDPNSSFVLYTSVLSMEPGTYTASAKVVGVSGENVTFDADNATLVSASASTVASLKVCSYITGGSNGSVAQFELYGSNVLYSGDYPEFYYTTYFSSDFAVKDNNCVEYYLGTNYEYYILQRNRMEYTFDFVSGLIDEDEEYFILEPKEYVINYYYNYENKKYFHNGDRVENDFDNIVLI